MILVTGGSGFIGSHIVRRLVAAGEPVRVLARDPATVAREGRLPDQQIEVVFRDVRTPAGLTEVMRGVHTVIHTVAIAVEKPGRSYETTNFQGTVNVVNAAKGAGIRRFVNLSQLGADPNLRYRFLASKGRAQATVAASGLDWTSFRPSVVWGPEDEFANTFARLVPFTPFIFPIIGGRKARFEPVWVEDLVTCILKVLGERSSVGKEYELGGPEVLTLEQIERRTLAAVGAKRQFVRVPLPLLRLVVALMESSLPSPPVTRSLLELLKVPNVTSNNAIAQFVSQPRPFTPENTAAYMRQFRPSATLASYRRR